MRIVLSKDISDKDILQVDGAIIAGALIFLSLSSGVETGLYGASNVGQIPFVLQISLAFISPFATSAILSIFGITRMAKLLMAVGFVVLLASIYLIINQLNSVNQLPFH